MFYISAGGNQIYRPLDDLLVLFNPHLTLEIGKAGSLEFDIPPVNPFYDRLNQLTTEVTVDMDDEEIFHGRVLTVERAFNNIRHVYCEGDLSYLIDSVQKGVQYHGTTHDLFNRIITNHNARVDANKRFTVGTVNIENRDVILVGHSDGSSGETINTGNIDYKQIALDSIVDEWNNSFDYIQTCLIDYCGGYLRTRRVNGITYIDLLDDFGSNSVQPIELGRNLLDLTEEVSAEDVFTVLIPLGDDNLTIASVNGGSDELVDTDAVKRYGRIVRTHVFNNVSSASTLLENARRFMATSNNVPRTINVRAVDLHLINKTIPAIKLGDKVSIASYVHEVDDILTCTKIEYDLEHPDNNNYTFGNPKQTLTQRYREDVRLSNDTYGNSAASTSPSAASPSAASAKGAGAAAAAAKAAEKEKDKSLKDFYETWIKQNDEDGTVSLGALYKKYIEDREVLINQCGIDLDASTGNININSLHKVVDDHGHQIAKNTANIDIIQEDDSEKYQAVLDRVEDLAGVEAQHHTEITEEVGVLGSQIGILASDINDYDDKLTKTVASINATANSLEARIDQKVSYIDTIDGRLTGRMASIEMWANSAESAIALKADKVYVDGLLEAEDARIKRLMAGTETASTIVANKIVASSMELYFGDGRIEVAPLTHSHNIRTRENDDGTITISIGTGTYQEIPQQASFKIADTKYFKDHASAVDIRSLEADSYSSTGDYEVVLDNPYVRYSNQQIVGRVRITLGNNDIKSAVVKVDGTRAYNAGIDYGAESAVAYSILPNGPAGLPTWDEEDEVWYANVPAVATAQGTRANGSKYTSPTFTRNLAVNVTAIYEKGKTDGAGSGSADVSVLTLGQDPDDIVTYSETVNQFNIPIKAELSNEKFRKITITISAEEATSLVKVNSINYYTAPGEETATYNNSDQTITATVQATLSNGNTNGSVRSVVIPALAAYKAGADESPVGVVKLNNVDWADSTTGYLYERANKRFKIQIRTERRNSVAWPNVVKVVKQILYVPAIEAYEHGQESADIQAKMTITMEPSSIINRGVITAVAKTDDENETVIVASSDYVYLNGSYDDSNNVVVTVTDAHSTVIANRTFPPKVYTPTVTLSASDTNIVNRGMITATATKSDGTTVSNNAYVYLNGSYDESNNVVVSITDVNSTVIATRTFPSVSSVYTPTITFSASDTNISNRGSITATATKSDGTTVSNSAYVYLNGSYDDSNNVVVTMTDANSTVMAMRVFPPKSSGISISRVNITRQTYNDYYWTGTAWHIPVRAYVYYSDGTYTTYDDDISVQDVVNAAQGSSSCSGHVEVTSTSGNSAFIKIYTSNWQAVSVGSSSVGKWITAGTSETFG